MAGDKERKSFWTTLPGVVTAVTGLVSAVGGLIGGLVAAGVIGGSSGGSTPTVAGPISAPTAVASPASAAPPASPAALSSVTPLAPLSGSALAASPPIAGPGSTPPPDPAVIVPTFQQQREKVAEFLWEINQASNDFQDSFEAEDIPGRLASGDFFQINAALTAALVHLEGYRRQMDGLTPPREIVELGELTAADQRAAIKLRLGLQQLQAGIQTGNQMQFLAAAQQFGQFQFDPDFNRPDELEQALLAKYNIPDAEVDYRRPP